MSFSVLVRLDAIRPLTTVWLEKDRVALSTFWLRGADEEAKSEEEALNKMCKNVIDT